MGGGGTTPRILNSALGGDEWSASRFSRFPLGERTYCIHWKWGWMGSIAGLDAVGRRGEIKLLPLPGIKSWFLGPYPVEVEDQKCEVKLTHEEILQSRCNVKIVFNFGIDRCLSLCVIFRIYWTLPACMLRGHVLMRNDRYKPSVITGRQPQIRTQCVYFHADICEDRS
jgi:hypothetical protein